MAPHVSIIVEYENATTHEGDEAADMFICLARQFAGNRPPGDVRDELILVFNPAVQNGDDIDRVIDAAAPVLREHLDIRRLPCPGLRYYELKNAGAAIARGEILVFLDSDSEPDGGWLEAMLAPFEDPRTTAVNGHTYLGYDGLLSRVMALTWTFPLRDDTARERRRRALNANNWAVRREWFVRNPFPYHPGFKVSCSLLSEQMRKQGVELVKVPAYVRHKPLEGVRFILWRAAITGRDDDARFATMRSSSRSRRLLRAVTRWVRLLGRCAQRIVVHHRAVNMPLYEIVPAIGVAWLFYSVAFVTQIGSALSRPRQEPERVPDFVLRH